MDHSRAAGLPDFRGLVLKVYEQLDKSVHELLPGLPATACKHYYINFGDLEYDQQAEVRRFVTAPKCYGVRPDPSHSVLVGPWKWAMPVTEKAGLSDRRIRLGGCAKLKLIIRYSETSK